MHPSFKTPASFEIIGLRTLQVFSACGFICCQVLRFSQRDEHTRISMINALPDEHAGTIFTGRVSVSPTI